MTPNTKLEAVNIMLSAIGESPVNRLSSGLVEAETAEIILTQTSRSVQAEGWQFNRETNVTVAPNLTGEIILATNTIRADQMVGSNTDIDLTQRGSKMYDRRNHTFKINSPVQLDITYELDFEELPAVARRYITIKSARHLQDNIVGSAELHGFHRDDEAQALFEMKDFENETADYNIADNYDVYRVIDRVGNKRVY
jgi:hypothetical protein